MKYRRLLAMGQSTLLFHETRPALNPSSSLFDLAHLRLKQ